MTLKQWRKYNHNRDRRIAEEESCSTKTISKKISSQGILDYFKINNFLLADRKICFAHMVTIMPDTPEAYSKPESLYTITFDTCSSGKVYFHKTEEYRDFSGFFVSLNYKVTTYQSVVKSTYPIFLLWELEMKGYQNISFKFDNDQMDIKQKRYLRYVATNFIQGKELVCLSSRKDDGYYFPGKIELLQK